MRVRIKKTNEIVQIRPSNSEPKKWLDLDNNKYEWDDFEPIRIESGTQVGVVNPITLRISSKSSGEID